MAMASAIRWCRRRGLTVKVYAQFDSTGRIQALTALAAPEGFGAALVTGPGSFVAEVEGVRLSEADVKDAEKLRGIATRHKSVKTFPRTQLADD